MHRFFVEDNQIKDGNIKIIGDDVNHIVNVLRLNIGDKIIICNRHGMEYCCIINNIDRNFVVSSIISSHQSKNELKSKIYLFQGIPKKDKMDMIIQKSIELGVYEIIPVVMSRTIVKINQQNEKKKVLRWNKIALSAAKQSNRGIIPKVTSPSSFDNSIEFAKKLDCVIVPYEKAIKDDKTNNFISNLQDKKTIGIFIGPEGGFEDKEINKLKEINSQIISLGKRILRTETASLAILSIIMYHLEVDDHGS